MTLQRTAALLALALAACARAPAPPEPPTGEPAASAETVRVRLSFSPDADLDLHVTDPRKETVYFANTPSRSGGELHGDVRCDSKGPRVEEITWAKPPPGRYQVGVDFPIRCRGLIERAPYVLEIWANGVRHEVHNAVAFGDYEPLVYEFDVRAATRPRGAAKRRQGTSTQGP